MKFSASTLAILAPVHTIALSKHPEELSLKAQRRLAASIAAITQPTTVEPFTREEAEQIVATGQGVEQTFTDVHGITPAEWIDADKVCAKHTGFANFFELISAKGSYTPTIYLDRAPMRRLADYYDRYMIAIGDERRAYRCGDATPNLRTYYVWSVDFGPRQVTQRKPEHVAGLVQHGTVRATSKPEAVKLAGGAK